MIRNDKEKKCDQKSKPLKGLSSIEFLYRIVNKMLNAFSKNFSIIYLIFIFIFSHIYLPFGTM